MCGPRWSLRNCAKPRPGHPSQQPPAARRFVCVWLLGVALLGVCTRSSPAATWPSKPNIIVIFTDDHGYADLSCQEVLADIRTPNIDALATVGVQMESGYVTAPQCVPSRAGIMTGRYQTRFGVESNRSSLAGFDHQQTLAQRLKRAGYATGMTGKWHLGPGPEIPQHGFDDVYYKHGDRPGWANFDLDGNDRPPGPEHSKQYHLDVNTAAACAFIKRHRNEPFFFYCAYRAPHVPLDPPQKYLDRFPGKMPERRRKALAMISAIDDGVGRILDTLRKHDLARRTLIFLIGDNGAPLKIHKLDAPGGGPGWDGSLNDPLNGEKGMLTEGGIRVPFVVSWPGVIPGGQVYKHPVISLDVAATAVALAGLPTDPRLDGVNLMPYLCGKVQGTPHAALYWRWIDEAAVREGRWKLLRGGAREYLFDLQTDREEKHNVLDRHPEIADQLREQLKQWAGQLDPPGLPSGKMAEVWERYFDYYLDGKPAPPPRAPASANRNAPPRVGDWLARNGTLKVVAGNLQVRTKSRRRPFIAASRLALPAQFVAVVRLRTTGKGKGGIAWRESNQRDFPPGQQVLFACRESTDFQTYRVNIKGHGKIIHVRLLLPLAGADVQSIEFLDAAGNRLHYWDFRGRSP